MEAHFPEEWKAIWNDEKIGPDFRHDFTHPNTYDIVPFLISDGKKHKTAIICPGGADGMVCSYVEGRPYALKLNEMGYCAVVVYYRCRELARYPAPQDDLARAVREIHERAEQWHLDMEGYSLWGSSAGGHLAGSFGTENMGYIRYGLPKPGAIILSYPVVTMTGLTHEGTRENLLGKHPSPEEINFASIEQNITGCYPPTFIWCGDKDATVPHENSYMLDAALEARTVPHRFIEYPGIDHGVGLGIGTVCESWFREAVAFWEAHQSNH